MEPLGNLEHHFHNLFADSRIPGEEFVYVPNNDEINLLEDYCSQSLSDSKPPLLICCDNGFGKSSLFSNWMIRRQRNIIRMRNNDEFIWWHAVGCTRQSTNVNNLIRRLIGDLKQRFELSREIPSEQERLSWELPRFIDLASKKGKLIIIIDGIDRLVSNDDSDAGLAWLPLEFPPSVRVILSINRSSKRKNSNNTQIDRLEQEKLRRHWQTVYLKPLDRSQCRSIINNYIQKTIQSEASTHGTNTSVFLTSDGCEGQIDVVGFLLFESNIQDLLGHPLSGLPLFLRLILRCTHYAVSRGFSLWKLWDNWLTASTVEELISKILYDLEQGYTLSENQRLSDISRSISSGGLVALKRLYPLHPAFAHHDNKRGSSDALIALDFRSQSDDRDLDNMTKRQEKSVDKPASNLLSESVLHNLGDSAWNSATEEAEVKIEEARMIGERSLQETIDKITKISTDECMSVVDAVFDHMKSMQRTALATGRQTISDSITEGTERPSVSLNINMQENEYDSEDEEEEGDDIVEENDSVASESTNSSNSENLNKDIKTVSSASNERNDNSNTVVRVGIKRNTIQANANQLKLKTKKYKQKNDNVPMSRNTSIRSMSRAQIAFQHTTSSVEDEDESNDINTIHDETNSDPKEGIEKLPVYLRGGFNCKGFENVLGDSLALLYVSRHGLREHELLTMLNSLRLERKVAESSLSAQLHDDAEIRDRGLRLLYKCIQSRGQLIELCRSYETSPLYKGVITTEKGHVPMDILYKCVGMIEKHVTPSDFDWMIKYCLPYENHSEENRSIDYYKLFNKAMLKRLHNSTNKNGGSVATISKDNGIDIDLDSFLLDQNESIARIGPVLEDALLSALKVVGVLHSQDNSVLLLPTDNDGLRQVIKENYINSDVNFDSIESVSHRKEEYWHDRLIKYFQDIKNSSRRSEELPWHLSICRRWHSLKDAISDIDTFEMMYGGGNLRLKDELISYWLLLTEGTLFTSLDKPIVTKSSSDSVDENKRVLTIMDTAAALGLSEKAAKSQLLIGQVAPFDIVEEINVALESWVNRSNPPPFRINFIIRLVGQFLVEFSKHTTLHPPFLRPGLDIQTMVKFGVTFLDIKELVDTGIATNKPNRPPNLNIAETVQNHSNTTEGTFPTQQMILSCPKLYFYFRWIWTQFPWLALSHALDAASTNEEPSQGSNRVLETPPSMRQHYLNDTPKIQPLERNRLWEVKKIDVNMNALKPSQNRRIATIRSNASAFNSDSLASLNVTFNRLYEESIKSVSFQAKQAPGYGLKKSLGLGQQHELGSLIVPRARALNNIKQSRNSLASLSLPSLTEEKFVLEAELHDEKVDMDNQKAFFYEKEFARVQKLKSLYDRLHAMFNEKTKFLASLSHQVKQREEQDNDIASNMKSGETAILSLSKDLSDLNEHLKASKSLQGGYYLLIELLNKNPPSNEGPLQSIELQLKLAQQQVADLAKHRHDLYITATRNETIKKNKIKLKLERFINAREDVAKRRREFIANSTMKGLPLPSGINNIPRKTTIRSAKFEDKQSSNKYDSGLNQSTDDSSDNSKPLNDVMRKFGEAISRRVLQFGNIPGDMDKDLASSSVDTRADTAESDVVVSPTPIIRNDLRPVKNRITIIHDTKPKLALINFKKTAALALEEANRKKTAAFNFERIREKTGCNTVEEFLDRYSSASKLAENLRSHQILADSKLAQLRSEYNELYNSYGDTVLVTTTGYADERPLSSSNFGTNENLKKLRKSNELTRDESKASTHHAASVSQDDRDSRYYEHKLLESESKLLHIKKQLHKLIYQINEVKSGVSHIMTLLRANAKLLTSLPRHPHPNDDSDVVASLSWCEERLLAINEVIMLEATKPISGTSVMEGDTQVSSSLYQRQAALASAVYEVKLRQRKGDSNTSSTTKTKKHNREEGGLARTIIDTSNDMNVVIVSSPRSILVTSMEETERKYDESVQKTQEERDERESILDQQLQLDSSLQSAEVVKLFLSEALNTHKSQELLRKNNISQKKSEGKSSSSFGWALESVLKSKGQSYVDVANAVARSKRLSPTKDNEYSPGHAPALDDAQSIDDMKQRKYIDHQIDQLSDYNSLRSS